MKTSKLNKILKDDEKYKSFLSQKLGITENIEFSKDILPYYIKSMAYSLGYNQIWLSYETKRIIYFIEEKEELSELREGCRFIIQHEFGHFHEIKDKNKNVRDYFQRLLYVNNSNYKVNFFPESEATRYAISKSTDCVEALAGFLAISCFLYKSDIKTAINSFSEHFSNSNIIDIEKRNLVNAKSSFKLSNGNYEKILKKTETYLNKLNNNLARSLLYKVKDKLDKN